MNAVLVFVLLWSIILIVLHLLGGCTYYRNGDQVFAEALTNRKIITPRLSQGDGNLNPLASVVSGVSGNQVGKSLDVASTEGIGAQEMPTVRITGADGSGLELYGPQDQTTGPAEIGNAVTNIFLINATRRVWERLIGVTGKSHRAKTAAGTEGQRISADRAVSIKELEEATKRARIQTE